MNEQIASNTNHFGLPGNDYGLIDKTAQAVGLSEINLKTAQPLVSQREHNVFFDTRNCTGVLSLREAQLAFAYVIATDGKIPPELFKNALNNSGNVDENRLLSVVQQMYNQGLITGFPQGGGPSVSGNVASFRLPKMIKQVKSIEIINIIIPRDIIPLYIYFPDFINNCLPINIDNINLLAPDSGQASSTWQSPIPATYEDFFDSSLPDSVANKLGGVYFTPLRYFRTYTGPNCMPNPHTPPPYNLWNPPQDNNSTDPWPFQPQPIRGQRVPTYIAKNGVTFSGYGLYDLEDFPERQELRLSDGNSIEIPVRKLILKLIVPEGQYINGRSAEDIIDDSVTNDFNNQGIVTEPLSQTGYGDYQRFIPGPGIGMNYQPNQPRAGKAAPIDLSITTYDSTTGYLGPNPVPFPNFRGNVWGPYSRPGDRFQNASLQLTVDELYLNGDLKNLEGNDIIWPYWDPSTEPYRFEYYVLAFRRPRTPVRFDNFESSSNINIKNAMRIQYAGGYGAVYSYIGVNTTVRGGLGNLVTGGLPNTQYDGSIHSVNATKWVTPAEDNPVTYDDSLPGPQKPSIVADTDPNGYAGWPYLWRTIAPQIGNIYVPVTAGGVGPMSRWDSEAWVKSSNLLENGQTLGSSQWADSPVIGQANNWCLPTVNETDNQVLSNQPWGKVEALKPWIGGTDYLAGGVYRVLPYRTEIGNSIITAGDATVGTVGSIGEVITITSFDPLISIVSIGFLTNALPGSVVPNDLLPSGDNCTVFIDGGDSLLELHVGGNNYSIQDNVGTRAQTGKGSGLSVNILSVIDVIYPFGSSSEFTVNGVVDQIEIANPGSGYEIGDVISIFQTGSNNNALFQVTNSTEITIDIVPEYDVWHYHDPMATGPSSSLSVPQQTQDLVNGIDICTTDCPDNCTPAAGEYVIDIGESGALFSDAADDPRQTPDPPELLKCDYVDQPSPEQEWEDDIEAGTATCRPLDTNQRIKQTSTYIDRRVAYSDFGQGNGLLITNLLSYRDFFVSSTPDTDIVVTIRQARRNVYTQSINSNTSDSNLVIPIRLNLGTTSGTLEYVEAVQGTLTSSGVYWKKNFYPPTANLDFLELEFTTYDGTPISLERTLGFSKIINEQATLLSSSIISSNVVHGSYSFSSPELPPFVSISSNSPSSVLLAGSTSTKGLTNAFNPLLSQYTQRNLSIMFKVINYHAENPGIQPIVKEMPEALRAQPMVDRKQRTSEEFRDLVPVASNLDEYF